MARRNPVPTGDNLKEQLAGNIARLVNRRRQEDARASLSERIAEWITRIAGSMALVLLHVVVYGGVLIALTDWIPTPISFDEGLGMVGSFASVEAIFLSLFVLMNQRREEQRADSRADLDLHVNLLTEDELTKLAAVIHRIAEKLDIELDREAVEEVEKNVDPEQVLDALEEVEADGGAPGHVTAHHVADAATGERSAMKASTAS